MTVFAGVNTGRLVANFVGVMDVERVRVKRFRTRVVGVAFSLTGILDFVGVRNRSSMENPPGDRVREDLSRMVLKL